MKKYFLDVLKLQYADFKGRASRRQFWMFVLYNVIAAVIVGIIGGIVGLNAILSGLYSLALLIPSLAISVRRLQDIDVAGYRQGVVLDFDQFDSAGGEHLVDRSLLPARHAVGQPVRKSARRRIRGRGTQETGRGVRMGRPGFLRHNRAVPVK